MKQPFTRATEARARADGAAGAGLGLAIVDRIARLHGGRFDLLPRDGGGTLARVTFPLVRRGSDVHESVRVTPGLLPYLTLAREQHHRFRRDALLAAGESQALGGRRLDRHAVDDAAEIGGDVRAHRRDMNGASFGACAMTVASTLPTT